MDLTIVPQTVRSQAVARIREAILTGVFPPGMRLVEGDLCKRMSVSRTTIREALRQLEAERLVTAISNRGGYTVTEMDWEEAAQLYDVRALLEGEAAALFAQWATPKEIADLKAALDEFSKAVDEDDALARLNTTERFYEIIQIGCRNKIVAEMLSNLVARITFLRARSMSQLGRSKKSEVEMRDILRAIIKKDPEAARQAATHHIRMARAAAQVGFSQIIPQPHIVSRATTVPPRRTRRRP